MYHTKKILLFFSILMLSLNANAYNEYEYGYCVSDSKNTRIITQVFNTGNTSLNDLEEKFETFLNRQGYNTKSRTTWCVNRHTHDRANEKRDRFADTHKYRVRETFFYF